jgi:hypothetical protein
MGAELCMYVCVCVCVCVNLTDNVVESSPPVTASNVGGTYRHFRRVSMQAEYCTFSIISMFLSLFLTGFTIFVNNDNQAMLTLEHSCFFWGGGVIYCGMVHLCDVKSICPIENITFFFFCLMCFCKYYKR